MSHDAEGTMSHERWLELAAAYALDALDASERTAFDEHLARCAVCRLAVQEYREVAGLLVHASEPTPAPTGLQDRVMSMLQSAADAPHVGNGRDVRARVAIDAGVTPITAAQAMRAPWRSAGVWLAAASLVVAAALGVLWRRSNVGEQVARDEAAALRRALGDRDSLLASLRGPRVHVVSLTAAEGGRTVARVFWNHELHRFVVTAFDIPAAQRGRTYQLWAIAKGRDPVSMGTFNTNAGGEATVILPVNRTIESLGVIDLCALTEEPDGGSPLPTETPRLAGSWRHTD